MSKIKKYDKMGEKLKGWYQLLLKLTLDINKYKVKKRYKGKIDGKDVTLIL